MGVESGMYKAKARSTGVRQHDRGGLWADMEGAMGTHTRAHPLHLPDPCYLLALDTTPGAVPAHLNFVEP